MFPSNLYIVILLIVAYYFMPTRPTGGLNNDLENIINIEETRLHRDISNLNYEGIDNVEGRTDMSNDIFKDAVLQHFVVEGTM